MMIRRQGLQANAGAVDGRPAAGTLFFDLDGYPGIHNNYEGTPSRVLERTQHIIDRRAIFSIQPMEKKHKDWTHLFTVSLYLYEVISIFLPLARARMNGGDCFEWHLSKLLGKSSRVPSELDFVIKPPSRRMPPCNSRTRPVRHPIRPTESIQQPKLRSIASPTIPS
jgi:hypothetical protein